MTGHEAAAERALRQAITQSRSSYVPGTPERYPRAELRGLSILQAEALAAALSAAQNALREIDEAARLGKIEVERGGPNRPVWATPNIAAHWFGIIRRRAALAAADTETP